MPEEEKDKGYVEGAEAILKEVELKVNRHNDEQVDKVIFHTDGGDITWKPKREKTGFEGGFKVVKSIPMEKDLLPKKLIEMANLCHDNGQLKIKVFYNWWKTEQDNNEVTYRFMTSETTFEKWEILDKKPVTETVLP